MLPRKNCVTKLILKYHENDNHAVVTNQMLVALSTRFWNISGREEIREWEKECNECHKGKAKPAKQIMDPPPQIRLRFFLRSFAQTAVDCDEPWSLCREEGHVDKNVTRVCLPAWYPEQSIWKWPLHLTWTHSWILSTEWSIGGGFQERCYLTMRVTS